MKVRFEVDDRGTREDFLRAMCAALEGLDPQRPAQWGRMTAQEMVEHLLWTFEVSNGRFDVVCPYPEEKQARMRTFLQTRVPMPREFRNPLLLEGLPAARYAALPAAVVALRHEVEAFLEGGRAQPPAVRVHPAFGPLTPEQWSRAHFKHGVHHLQQFGLAEIE